MEKTNKKRPLVFLDVSIDGDVYERMAFELFTDVAPKTAENFHALCTGEKVSALRLGSLSITKEPFSIVLSKGYAAQGGDFLRQDGMLCEWIFQWSSFSFELLELNLVSLCMQFWRKHIRWKISRLGLTLILFSLHWSFNSNDIDEWNNVDVKNRLVKAKQVTFHQKNLQYYEISAKSNYNFKKPFSYLPRKLAGDATLHFVESSALAPPEVQIDLDVLRQHEAELVAAANQPFPDGDNENFDYILWRLLVL